MHIRTFEIGAQLKPKRCLCDFGELPELIRVVQRISHDGNFGNASYDIKSNNAIFINEHNAVQAKYSLCQLTASEYCCAVNSVAFEKLLSLCIKIRINDFFGLLSIEK